MSNASLDLQVTIINERRKRKRMAVAGFFFTAVAIIGLTYCQRRTREIPDISEDSISLLYSKDHHATGEEVRTGSENTVEMIAEDGTNSATNSSAQTCEENKRKRYRSDDSIASMLGEKLDNFTTLLQVETAQASKVAPPEEILTALNQIPGLEEDELLAAYDILVSNDRKFKSLVALPERMKKRWILKQLKP